MLLIKYSNLTIIVVFHNSSTLVLTRFHFAIHVRETFILSIAFDMILCVHVYINQSIY